MGVDAKIILKNHASVNKVFDVMARVLGAEIELNYRAKDNIDLSQPSSSENSWTPKVIHNPKDSIEFKDFTFFEINLKDICGNEYNSLFFYDLDDSEDCKNGERLLAPKSSACWLAVGEKLVEFFGGKLVFADCEDSNDPENIYVVDEGLYSSSINHSDDRWYSYNNALKNIQPITAEDVLRFKDVCCYWGEREDSLVEKLPIFANYNKLEKDLNKDNKILPKKNKI